MITVIPIVENLPIRARVVPASSIVTVSVISLLGRSLPDLTIRSIAG